MAALEKAAENLLVAVRREAEEVNSESEGKVFRDRWMARKNGILTQINDLWLKAAPQDAKRDVGQRVNEIKKQCRAGTKSLMICREQAGLTGSELQPQSASTSRFPAFAVRSEPNIPLSKP